MTKVKDIPKKLKERFKSLRTSPSYPLTTNCWPVEYTKQMEVVYYTENFDYPRLNMLQIDLCLNVYLNYESDVIDRMHIDDEDNRVHKFINSKVKLIKKLLTSKAIHTYVKNYSSKYLNLTLLTEKYTYASVTAAHKILEIQKWKCFRSFVYNTINPFEVFLHDVNFKIKELNNKLDSEGLAPLKVNVEYKALEGKDFNLNSYYYTFKFDHDQLDTCRNLGFIYIDNVEKLAERQGYLLTKDSKTGNYRIMEEDENSTHGPEGLLDEKLFSPYF